MAKAKWLEEATIGDLLGMLEDIVNEADLEKKDSNKAKKIFAELQERLPEDSEQTLSVEEAIANLIESFTTGVAVVSEAYQAEFDAIGDSEEDEELDDEEEVDEDEEDEEVDAEDDEDEDDEDDEDDYESMSIKELKAVLKEKGIKFVKGWKKDDILEALAEGEEDEEEEEDEDTVDYTEMSQKDLKALCRERGLKVTKSMKKANFIKMLEADDEE